ncbi:MULTISPECIES: alpha-galactosidase [unclassified Rathayibacter]|uniref:alpha-galactosidase n=1 Tax=unclassified Rathayibacter TaxID=2609250 RepID=UPI0009E6FFEB|nr:MULTISPECIES: alpha-galactosidase [unclassified Rathayibacter]
MSALTPTLTGTDAGTIRIDAGDDALDLVLAQDGDEPLRVLRFGPRGASGDLATGRPVLEVVTSDSGRAPSTPRLIGGQAGLGLRYRSHRSVASVGVVSTIVLLRDDEAGLEAELRLEVVQGAAAVRCTTVVRNTGTQRRVLRSVTSMALRVGVGSRAETRPTRLSLTSGRSDWVGESRWSTAPLDTFLVDLRKDAHGGGARNGYAVTSTGTWSTAGTLPVGVLALSDPAEEAALAWQVEHNGGWRWEVGEDPDGTYLALSGPTDQDHQWLQPLEPGGSFTTVPVLLSAGRGFDKALAALTDGRRTLRRPHPDSATRPVVFNDYMNTLMGDPTTARLLPLIDQAAEAGAEIFCIDAGWYDDSGDWWYSVGDWQPSTVRFPDGGLMAVLNRIRERDMVPGLWLEPEVIGVSSPAAERLPDDAFLQRLGERLVEHGRYTLDLRHPAAIAHLDGVIDRLVGELGVGYLKLDYNIDAGAGTDVGAPSVGAGLLEHNRAHLAWLDAVLDRHPDLVLENCASGAMRMDGAMLSRLQLQSTSDQQDPIAYPPIAAAAPLAMIPEQAANWAYPQPDMSDEAIAFTLCTAMLGRFYLSGRLDGMSPAQRMLVAEGVAAHKRLRPGLARAHAAWPLGIDLWTAPWVALALGDEHETHLTLWRREGDRSIDVPLPAFRGGPLVVETVFPRRLTPWLTEWDQERGVLTVTLPEGDDEPAARTFRIGRAPFVEHVVIDASATTGAVHGGATGMLYGLASPDAPSSALLSGIRPRTLAQKAPGGRQHPGGDALEVADDFFAAGGEEMVVYLQDLLEQWPYEEIGVDRYAELVQDAVRTISRREDRDRFVYVPFNEGDWIWYAAWDAAGRDRFLADWTTLHRAIRAIDPEARIVGPNESHYYPNRVRDLLEYGKANGVLPDIMAWHELQPSSLELLPRHLEHYRALEEELSIPPLPVNIDEYANRRDTSVPGRLIQWIDILETGKIDGDLAYWTMAGNLDDHAVGRHQANGGWWLLHWYAALRGETVRSETAASSIRDSLHSLAARDGDTVTALIGGGRHPVEVEVRGLATDLHWRVAVERVEWSGYEGPLSSTTTVVDAPIGTSDGGLRFTIANDDPLAAYRVTIAPDDGTPPTAVPAAVVVPADVATGEGLTWSRHDDDMQQYAGTGRSGISGTPDAGSRAEFPVVVEQKGEHLLALYYGTDSVPATAEIEIDGRDAVRIDLPATLARGFTGRVETPVRLDAGPHVVAVRPLDGADLAIDRVELHTIVPVRHYPASRALHTGGEVRHGADGERTAVIIGPDDSLSFHIGVPDRARYRLSLDSDAGATVELDGTVLTRLDSVVLPSGISEVRITAGRPTAIRALTVERSSGGTSEIPVSDERWRLTGGARLSSDTAVPVIDGLGSADGRPAGAAELVAPSAGRYLLSLRYSNADRRTGHLYNTDVIDRHLQIRAGDAPAIPVTFPFTHDWTNFATVSVSIDVPRGADVLHLTSTTGAGPLLAGAALDKVEEGGPIS